MKKYGYILLVLLCATACQFRDDYYVDYADLDAAKGLAFKVIGQHETDLSKGIPYNCYLPDGTPLSEYSEEDESTPNGIRKTSSVTGTAIVQQMLKYGNQNKVIEIVGTYPSIDGNWDAVTLSGKVMLPKGRKPKRMILVSHYTVCSNAEAPSNCFSLEGVLVKLGYGLVIPDYMGYGVTADKVHPYLVMDLTARNVLDMYLAVRQWLQAVDMEPEHDDIYLMGYSQGGATTMAVEYLIENEYSWEGDPEIVKVHRVFAGGGPYDVKATYERFVNTDTAGYPVAVPLVLQGMILGNNLKVKMTDLMQPWLYEKMDDWINSKIYSSAQINKLIGTKVTHELLTQEAMDQTSDNVAELYKAMTVNSIISYNWVPQNSVYIMHSMDDETVPYANAANAKSKWRNANITYNFGHYGSHVKTALRFIYSVQTLLKDEEKEQSIYNE
ncbi:MAG: hypothetical protein II928_02305 [Paludibacteraceae bacterium]|nr:hypothetical protein [Paludibacteraceae bacterium]